MTNQTDDAVLACEKTIKIHHAENLASKIWPSAEIIAKHLLERREEMHEVYQEIYSKLSGDTGMLYRFFDLVLTTTVVWSPQAIEAERQAYARLTALNSEIHSLASALSKALDERDEIHNSSGFYSDTHYHVSKVIDVAGDTNCLFTMYLRQPLKNLRAQYSLKYWPSMAEFIEVIGLDAATSAVAPTDAITSAATSSPKRSLADVARAFLAAFDEASDTTRGWLPSNFKISDKSVSAIINCTLDLDPDRCIDAGYIKAVRQRDRRSRKMLV